MLALLAIMVSASATNNAIQRKMGGKGAMATGKGITLVIWNEDLDQMIGIIRSLKI